MNSVNAPARSLLRRSLRLGLASSLLLHAALLAVMVVGNVRSWLDQRPISYIQASATYQPPTEPDDQMVATVVIDEDDPPPVGIQQQFDQALAAGEQMSEAERIEALDSATNRLHRISSEASVDDVAKRLQSLFGLSPRADSPADEVAGEPDPDDPMATDAPSFDFETAQLHDVRRETDENGSAYLCVLLDAQGRTFEVPLSDAEGEPIYALMEKIKASPLLERIYRQLAMPMLDQLVKAQRVATQAARPPDDPLPDLPIASDEKPVVDQPPGDAPTTSPEQVEPASAPPHR